MAKQLYQGSYPVRAKIVRDRANADPSTRCRRCRGTYAEAKAKWGAKGAAWQAGHVVDGHPGSPLAPEHAYCNLAAGGRMARARDEAKREPKSPNS